MPELIRFSGTNELEEGYMGRIMSGEVTLHDQAVLLCRTCEGLMEILNAIPPRVRHQYVQMEKEGEAISLMLGAVQTAERDEVSQRLGAIYARPAQAEPDGEVQDT